MKNADIEPYGSASFLAGGGEMGSLLRAFDWADSPLGLPADWPQSLKTAIRIMLMSRQPIWVGWGSKLTFFYNDAYKAIIGGKHPWALGRPTSEVWREIWADIGPLLATAMGGIEGTYVEEQLLIMERNGYPEETYYTFSYSPIPTDDGTPGGIICANTDDTKRVIGERQLALLRDLASATADARAVEEVCHRAVAAFGKNSQDLPFALIYRASADGATLLLNGAAGIKLDHPAAPATVPIDANVPWRFADALAGQEIILDKPLAGRFNPAVPSGAWHQPLSQVALLPVMPAGDVGPRGVLVVGLNPFRLLDGAYRDFLSLLSGQMAAAVASADAYEQERRRAESLAAIDRAKINFFSNVSHEFRTPLTLMLGPLEEALSEQDRLSALHRERLQVIHRNGIRLLRLVNSLLDFSRVEAGRGNAKFEPTALAEFTAELASNFRSATEKAGLALHIDCPPLDQAVYVDRDMWEKVVLNLLSNAFKFTFEGSITVSLQPRGAVAELSVRDTGTGVPSVELPRLFERFHRIEGARGRSFEGSGIGLALVKELVETHGGAIRADSQEGEGTTFYVTVPFGSAHLPAEQIRSHATAGSAGKAQAQALLQEALSWLPDAVVPADVIAPTADDMVRMETTEPQDRSRILVVDDNADMRAYLCRLLISRYECSVAEDGQMALDLLHSRRPDLVLTDIMMPRLDGFGLIKAVRSDPELRDLPVIVLSARAGEESSVEGIAAGADDYLVKPFSARELLARVDGALGMARVRREMGNALRDLVAERTAELEAANAELRAAALERAKVEQALRQSQKMEAVGKLTGGIAHDFNNLLQVISGNLQLLSKDVAGSERAERRLANAIAGVSRGSKLAAQLLAFGRRQPLAPKIVNLGRLLRGLDDLLRRALGDGVEIETVVTGGLWNTLVDPSQVENALLNLAINARDAMNGHGRLTIEAGNAALSDDYAAQNSEVSAGQYVMLAVTDTGCGMAPDVIEHVFEPFFTTKPEGRGTGLGLSMVYGFVKQSEGHIKIYSEPGQGSTIRLYLPRALGAEEIVSEVDAGPIIGGTESVLAVEDDDEVRGTVVEMLADLGYRVLKARDAASALAIIESGAAIDLLFTDVVMPGSMRSPELARQARIRLPDLAVLFTSGYTDNAIFHGGRLDHGIELLSKPYTREALARKVRQVLRNQRQRAAATVVSPEPAQASRLPPRGWKVLFVEDDELIRLVITDMLAGLGHEVYGAGDADEALRLLTEAPVDVLMTDLELPGMSGEQLAVEARRRRPDLKVVFATGADELPNSEGANAIEDGLVLRKPYNTHALDEVLRKVGERRRAARS